MSLTQALDETRTGDVWLFRGGSGPDRAIQTLTNAPINHVGMTVAIDDMPPLMWHAELGHKLIDLWTGTNHRGVQLNDARQAVEQWLTEHHPYDVPEVLAMPIERASKPYLAWVLGQTRRPSELPP